MLQPRRIPHQPLRLLSRLGLSRNYATTRAVVERGPLIPAPKPGSGPLMERRPNRELPDPKSAFRWYRTFPIFAFLMLLSAFAIFNYQKSSSPVVSAILYALRTNSRARAILGDNIYFAQQIPWISGTMDQLHGRIDISFKVKGTKREGLMRFASFRPTAKGVFETTEWSLETVGENGRAKKLDLLDEGDPFRGITASTGFREMDDDTVVVMEDEEETPTRGFRQMR